ncbi:hypothetical protein G9A89_003691 [Geosiphon pyriformis]|nr:hypothetical protein G9A89_003691 [Geosiphon pyriformis]
MGRHSFPVLNQQFLVDDKYQFIRELGQGAYGVVCYLYEELMEADLHAIIRSKQPLTDAHYQSFTYQIFCGLKYIHSANVLHRDLKPGNLLVNADCELKICDFGLARGFSENIEGNSGFMTEYVVTQWYRAPELMLSFQNYTKAMPIDHGNFLNDKLTYLLFATLVDLWSEAYRCLKEGITLGTPNDETLTKIGSPRTQEYIRNLPYIRKKHFQELIPNANPLAIDLIERLLSFDPSQRITVEQALEHHYLAV